MRNLTFLIASVFAVLLPAVASAGTIAINPISVNLTKAYAGELLTLQNSGDTPIQMQASVYQWSQTPLDRTVMKSTHEIVATPSIFTIAPGGVRQVRIGGVRAPDAAEHAYRVLFREIRPQQMLQATGVSILTDVTVPVFIQATGQVQPDLRIAEARSKRDRVEVDVRNTGAGHALLPTATMVLYDAGNNVIGTAAADAWYILPGSDQRLSFPIAAGICQRARTVSVTLSRDKESKLVAATVTPACKEK